MWKLHVDDSLRQSFEGYLVVVEDSVRVTYFKNRYFLHIKMSYELLRVIVSRQYVIWKIPPLKLSFLNFSVKIGIQLSGIFSDNEIFVSFLPNVNEFRVQLDESEQSCILWKSTVNVSKLDNDCCSILEPKSISGNSGVRD